MTRAAPPFGLFPTVDEDPALARHGRKISPAAQAEAARRRQAQRDRAGQRALERASKAAGRAGSPADSTAPAIDRAVLRKLLASWRNELDEMPELEHDKLIRLLEAVAYYPSPPGVQAAYRRLLHEREAARRAAGAEADERARRLAANAARLERGDGDGGWL